MLPILMFAQLYFSCGIIPITTENVSLGNIFPKNSLPGYQGDNSVSEEMIYETRDVCRK